MSVDIAKASHELKPNSAYLYSLRATNMDGTTYGANKEFKTAAASQPVIESESVSHLIPTDATLEGQINTEGLETTYNFYLQESPLCFKAVPPCERPQHEPIALPAGKLLGSYVGQSVSVELNSAGVSLSPGEHYEYWVTATSLVGTITGAAREFTATEAGAPQPLNTTPPSGSHSSSGPASSGGQGTVTPTGNDSADNEGTPSPEVTVSMNTQKLAKAVRACKHRSKRQRASCVKQARKRYGKTASKA